jgi:gamma-glutamyltranspeptidase
MNLEDLKNHQTTFDDPIFVDYKGHKVWEMPPNGQGNEKNQFILLFLFIFSNIQFFFFFCCQK